MNKGIFIVLEGIDGSGKTTLCEDIYKYFLKKKINVNKTSEPTNGPIGFLIRNKDINFCLESETLLFLADRAQHTFEINNWIKEGKSVICDRYFLSTYAYQLASSDNDKNYKKWLLYLQKQIILEPDIIFLLDINPKHSLSRIKNREEEKLSKFENINFLKKVRKNYLSFKKYNILKIDAKQKYETVLAIILKEIDSYHSLSKNNPDFKQQSNQPCE